jgi:predicted MPP superfamily phosphohydrolase
VPTFWLPPGCNGRIEGHHGEPGRRLYINRGLGWSFLPLRWNCTPEIACIEWIDEGA